MNRMRKINKKGFTLIEVMLSIAILALISVPLMKYFSDSLKYSAQTAEKQNANFIAQETMEAIKAQRKIVIPTTEPAVGGGSETVKYKLVDDLNTLFGGYAGAKERETVIPPKFEETGATIDDSGAVKELKYYYIDQKSQKYYMEVSFKCETEASKVDSPVILGIDDTKNVMISDNGQERQAMTELGYKNGAYCGELEKLFSEEVDDETVDDETVDDDLEFIKPSTGPISPSDPIDGSLTEEQIKNSTRRIIYITITRGSTDKTFNVKANAVYTCYNEFIDASGKFAYPAPNLVDTDVATLNGIYIMFKKFNDDYDEFVVNWKVDPTYKVDYPDFRFIVQDSVEEASAEGADPALSSYYIRVFFNDMDNPIKVQSNNETFDFRKLKDGAEYSDPFDFTDDIDGGTILNVEKEGLTGEGIPVRVFDVSVNVYKNKKSYENNENALIQLKSSKVE